MKLPLMLVETWIHMKPKTAQSRVLSRLLTNSYSSKICVTVNFVWIWALCHQGFSFKIRVIQCTRFGDWWSNSGENFKKERWTVHS